MTLVLAVLGWQITPGAWQSGARHDEVYGHRFNHTASLLAWSITPKFEALVKQRSREHPHLDVYEFRVYTGGTMRRIGEVVPSYRHMWGFDSFRGLPTESADVPAGKLAKRWQAGAFSAADALKVFDGEHLMRHIKDTIGHANVTLVPGFYNESLPPLKLSRFKPALLVDVDCDIYTSAKDVLSWLFASKLVVPGTLVRYDDWRTRLRLAMSGGCATERGSAREQESQAHRATREREVERARGGEGDGA